MSYYLSVDPGLRTCGVALWTPEGKLVEARLIKSKAPEDCQNLADLVFWMAAAVKRGFCHPDGSPHVETLLVEVPQVYPGPKQKTPPNDLISVACVVGALTSHFKTVVYFKPREWKGNIPKRIKTQRIKRDLKIRLTPDELQKINLPSAKSLEHNVYDALGLGMHFFRTKLF